VEVDESCHMPILVMLQFVTQAAKRLQIPPQRE
jgi:hypothetical protein